MSYADKRRNAIPCTWPSCDEVGSTLALDPRNSPQWFCSDHAAVLKDRKK